MKQLNTDILVAGAGPAGLSAALAMADIGLNVALVERGPAPSPKTVDDRRSTAILQPGRSLLEKIGAWSHFESHARPLGAMRIINASGPRPARRDFCAGDLGKDAFGWNIANGPLRIGLANAAAAHKRIAIHYDMEVTNFLARQESALLRLSDGTQVTAKLAIACDGRQSTLRGLANIPIHKYDIGQKALVFSVTHPEPHEHVSTEVHKSGGPFTLVPLPDHNGAPCSAVVWMTNGPEIARLSALSDEDFSREASARCDEVLGPLTLCSARQTWPISSQIAKRFDGSRLVLAAEAAHGVPPIGAQGLNMSLADIAWLHGRLGGIADPGAPSILATYNQARRRDVAMRMVGIDMLNRASASTLSPIHIMRGIGLQALHDISPLRRNIMRLGLGG